MQVKNKRSSAENIIYLLSDPLLLEKVKKKALELNSMFFDNLYNELIALINNKITETLIYEYNYRKNIGQIPSETHEKRLEYFSRMFKMDFEETQLFLEKYPMLSKIIKILINDYLLLINRIMDDYSLERNFIEEKFGKLGQLEKVSSPVGDIHEGKAVVLVCFEHKKLVYKPRTCDADILIAQLLKLLSDNSNSINIITPLIFDGNDHYWQEFILHKNCESELQVHQFYYNAGVYLAILFLLSSADIHFENLISYGQYPMIIDFETLTIGEREPYTINRSYKSLYDSVYLCNLIPSPFENPIYDVDLSALFTDTHESEKIYQLDIVFDEENDWIFKKRKVRLDTKNNTPTLEGLEIKPYLFTEDIVEGFREAMFIFMTKKTKTRKVIEESYSKNFIIRQVLRPTRVYSRFIEASQHPQNLTNEEKFENAFELLFSNFKVGKFGYLRVISEVNDMKKGYIPIFYALSNERHLYSNNKLLCEDYFLDSPLGRVRRKLDEINPELIDFQIRLIKISVLTKTGLLAQHESFSSCVLSTKRKLTRANVDKIVLEFSEYLSKNIIKMDNSNYYSIITPTLIGDKFLYHGMDYGMYQIGGMIWFLAIAGCLYNNLYYQEQAKGMLDILIEKYYKEYPEKDWDNSGKKNINADVSYYSGIGGLLYLTYNFYILFEDKKYIEVVEGILPNIIRTLLNQENYSNDYLNSSINSIQLLCMLHKANKSLVSIETLDNICDVFVGFINSSLSFDSKGFAHGSSGVWLVLVILFSILKRKDLLENSEKILYQEQYLSLPDSFSWCRGKGGVLFAKKVAKKFLDQNNSMFKIISGEIKSMEKEVDKYFQVGNCSVCHGLAGAIETFNSSDLSRNPFAEYLLEKRFESLKDIQWLKESDYYYEPFMLGASGVAYSLLRLYYPIPSVLEMEFLSQKI